MMATVDDFPYKRYSMPDKPEDYFRRAQSYCSTIEERILRTPGDEAKMLRPDSVVSKTSRRDFLEHFPLHYDKRQQTRRALIIRTPRDSYDLINILPDYYTEDARVRDTGAYEKVSPYEYWKAHSEEISKQVGAEATQQQQHARREFLWKHGPTEARQGKITNYLTLFSLLKSRVVLDPSAAWGDRLIAALASPSVKAYTGVDPHSRLARGWQEILDQLGPLSGKPDYRERFIMLNEPFEPAEGDATDLPEGMGNYDTVIISTAPLYGDQYDLSNPTQAVVRHGSSYKSYVRGFLIPYLSRAIAALKVDGYLCMTVLDRAKDGYYITELQLLLVELLMDNVMHYRGVIWWTGDSGGLVPWWTFVKVKGSISQTRIREARRLYQPYAEILKLQL